MDRLVLVARGDYQIGDIELFAAVTHGRSLLDAIADKPVLDDDGRPIPDPTSDKGRPLMRAQVHELDLPGLVYIAMRRVNPRLTAVEFLSTKLSDIDIQVEQDPTPQATEGSNTKD